MFKTRITELFGIESPLLVGGMQWVSRAELVAAAANAGGLGFLTASTFDEPEDLRKEIRKARELTDKPIGVNFGLFPSARPTRVEEKIAVAVEEKVPVFETSGRNPEPYLALLRSGGAKVMHKCARVRDAVSVQKAGVDAVCIVGFEAGGSPGMDEVTTLVLVPKVRELISLPLVAGGGFANAHGFVAALALGAEGVLMATRFMATTECMVHPGFKEWMVKAAETDTALIQKSIRSPSRVMRNEVSTQVLEMEAKGTTLEELMPLVSGLRGRTVYNEGKMDAGIAHCGQAVGLVSSVKSVKEVYEEITEGATKIINDLKAISG